MQGVVPDQEMRAYLEQILFFTKLNAEDQRLFLERMQYFLKKKHFQGMEGLNITNEIRTIVAASAVQLTLRLPKWKFKSFHLFRIYPESFYSNIMRRYLKGGAGKTGQIWFSLKDYRAGYASPESGINLGLHEMAHALIIEMENGNLDHEFTLAFEKIEKIAKDRIPKIRSRQFTYLRDYAGTSEMEFIAVTTEYFFEQPEKLSKADRELYEAFAALYRYNPVPARATALKITPVNYEEIEAEEKTRRNYRFAKWHWSLTLTLVGIFLSPVMLLFLLQDVMLSAEMCWAVAGGIFVVSSILLYGPIVKSKALGVTQFFLCHIFGLWPLVLCGFFLLNNYIPVWKEGEAHVINKIYWESSTRAIVNYVDGAYDEEKLMRTVYLENENDLKAGDIVVVVTQFGPFGVPVAGKNLVVTVPGTYSTTP